MQGDSDVTVGNTIQFTCSLEDVGVPTATLKWQFSNGVTTTELNSQGPTLSLSSVQREDEGTYFCWGQNAVGTGTKGAFAIGVNTVPVLKNDGWPANGRIDVSIDDVSVTRCEIGLMEGQCNPGMCLKLSIALTPGGGGYKILGFGNKKHTFDKTKS